MKLRRKITLDIVVTSCLVNPLVFGDLDGKVSLAQGIPKYTSREKRELPAWATQKHKTEHFIYYFSEQDKPNLKSLEAQEKHYEFFKKTFQIEVPQQISYIKSPIKGSGGFVRRGYINSQWWFHPHEAVHFYLTSRNKFLREGIAEAFGTTFYQGFRDFGKKTEINSEKLISAIENFAKNEGESRYLANNFVRWLYFKEGSAKLVSLFRKSTSDLKGTEKVFLDVYKRNLQTLAEQWINEQEWLSKQQPPEGFFIYKPWTEEKK